MENENCKINIPKPKKNTKKVHKINDLSRLIPLKRQFLRKETLSAESATRSIPAMSSKAFAVVDVSSGDILWNKNAREKREIASLTKMMTAYISITM
jgi:D-alanyl-D-alanine carboxypeptidase